MKSLGIYTGVIDGGYGPATETALSKVAELEKELQADELRETQFSKAMARLKKCSENSGKNFYDNCFGTRPYSHGNKYIGEWHDDMAEGQGIYIWASGLKYLGGWRNGRKHGQGSITYLNGDKYLGEWRSDMANGQGTYLWVNGQKYVGEWRDDRANGHGTFVWASGRK